AWSGVMAMAGYALAFIDEGNAEGDYAPLFEQVAVAVGASADHASYSALYTQVHEAVQAADGKYA
ncbi:unnamed protein product, partial [Prorocentrum cordatum]